jgi:hypothetical protein
MTSRRRDDDMKAVVIFLLTKPLLFQSGIFLTKYVNGPHQAAVGLTGRLF